ncbi:hypothetical protein LN051_00610 [Staphylococcus ratti]|uniref:Phage protein n=1 Tax=Staphylococcus ratti TaxID=2892440 RepID=A0ABY3PFK6_9STAP|nr:hypothetical protein [Staphylococcus ratti]UEX91103.1 hypothetical protein LN051_00610 [Staphylococcus ratti]
MKLSQKSFRFDVYHTSTGYKMVPLTYLDVKKKDTYYYIPDKTYKVLLQKKNIDQDAKFIGSFYYNDLIKFNEEMFKVIGVNNIKTNKIELDMIDIRYKEYCELNDIKKTPRIIKIISKNTNQIEKYTTDILGNLYKATPPKKPQLIFKRGI